ncbi:uncharacterized protein PV07_12827 [Cladophialophora immunda]|uniref:Uncharacterized protein n=1 Tax=Cladophialophora immunda TaxID=569365 RepID=A0A0D2AAD8_9EURO|nr:uncharacterized protein PV07_12827 [Cladophialophora immunda]KIW21742.1 hypothetical protein PV07_12827 [Cladophialophora immunda]
MARLSFITPIYREVCDLIKVRKEALKEEWMEDFINAKDSFDKNDGNDQKLVKLLDYTRGRMVKY